MRLLSAVSALAIISSSAPAWADYIIRDGENPPVTQTVKAFTYGGGIGPQSTIVDSSGNPMGTVSNPLNVTGASGGGTVNQGTPNTASNGWPVKPTDGTNSITIRPASSAPASTDTAQVVTQRPDGATIAGASVGTAGSPSANVVSVQGNSSNASSAVAAASANIPSLSFNYAFNGTTWDQLQVDGSKNLKIVCSNCSGSGASAVDEGAFTAGSSVFAPAGGFYQTTATGSPLVSGQQGLAQLTINRALHVNLRNSVGVEEGNSTTPLQVSLANTGANGTAVATSLATLPALTAGSALIGKVGIDQTTPGTTNAVSATGAAASGASKSGNPVQTGGVFNTTQPTVTNGQMVEQQSTARGAEIVATGVDAFKSETWDGTNTAAVKAASTAPIATDPALVVTISPNSAGLSTQASASAAISTSSAAATQIIALSSGKSTYITNFNFIANGTTNVTLEYGTGTNCGTLVGTLTGAYNLTAQNGIAVGGGLGPVLVVPASDEVCILNSAAIQVSGSIAYTQF